MRLPIPELVASVIARCGGRTFLNYICCVIQLIPFRGNVYAHFCDPRLIPYQRSCFETVCPYDIVSIFRAGFTRHVFGVFNDIIKPLKHRQRFSRNRLTSNYFSDSFRTDPDLIGQFICNGIGVGKLLAHKKIFKDSFIFLLRIRIAQPVNVCGNLINL